MVVRRNKERRRRSTDRASVLGYVHRRWHRPLARSLARSPPLLLHLSLPLSRPTDRPTDEPTNGGSNATRSNATCVRYVRACAKSYTKASSSTASFVRSFVLRIKKSPIPRTEEAVSQQAHPSARPPVRPSFSEGHVRSPTRRQLASFREEIKPKQLGRARGEKPRGGARTDKRTGASARLGRTYGTKRSVRNW